MRLGSFRRGEVRFVGALHQEQVVTLRDAGGAAFTDLLQVLSLAAADQAALAAGLEQATAADRHSLADLAWRPPLERPGKIVCLGLNYHEHEAETGQAHSPYPSFFLRAATSLLGHGAPIVRPVQSQSLDYEGELAAVVGTQVRHATRETALAAIAGYSIFNDASVRDYQFKSSQWTMGKNFDATGAFGPWFVSADELPPGARGLALETRLNGAPLQRANTSQMICDVVEAVALISECMTLEVGDVLVMGTPGGVGMARNPPTWMAPGDVCEVEIEGIGVLSNPISQGADHGE